MKAVPVEEAVGMVLGHDITRIEPGKFKGRAFRRGCVIREEDIPELLDLGKENIYVLDLAEGLVHEDDAATRIARAAAGSGIALSEPSEGKVNLSAAGNGLLKVNPEILYRINDIEDIAFATLHTDQAVSAGRILAGTRVIPLAVPKEKVERVEALCAAHYPLIQIKPFRPLSVGVVTTGSEVYHGRIEDKFGPVLLRKFDALGSRVMRQVFVSDEIEMTVRAIKDLLSEGAEIIAVTGGMSVDPDDRTPAAIRAAGGDTVAYGAPVLPGAMFMLAYIGSVPILGLPGCVMYHRASVFDLVVPRILAGETIARADLIALGHGGLCDACEDCRFPSCSFGK